MTRKEYDEKITALEPLSEEQRKEVTCALLGHSHITTGFLGYVYCARCGEKLGDMFAGFTTILWKCESITTVQPVEKIMLNWGGKTRYLLPIHFLNKNK